MPKINNTTLSRKNKARLSSWQRYCAVASINRHLTGAGSIAPEKTVQVIDVITEM
ncbi:TPA: hypothetical protein ACPZCM_001375 [Yersinia enterocolitica]|uniref:hypothetical protein n=1 Tax=Yersinia enterocolitica TaxID=630 RepID=UPI0002E309C6|nr:hypothetical protein [Yersinia enterocolitica]EKN3692186.1 hypothetical protein [Yersinia enterocolitica]EKN3720258.1 hypothetical protein [Yersinia enterocolitica]ELI8218951.1 hypothetical protein [Yersinia enterocolitica]ELI8287366.1 hypothetical protein [Yersinia enterocolitica]MCE3112700.1 hypothetical protein [Yersinia enterocolitica]